MITVVFQLRDGQDEVERTYTDLAAAIAEADRVEAAGGRAEIVHATWCRCPLCTATDQELAHAIVTATAREARLQTLAERADANSERAALTEGVVLTGVLGLVAGGLLRGPVAAVGLGGLLVALAAAKAVVWPRLTSRLDPAGVDALPAGPPRPWQPEALAGQLLVLAKRDLHDQFSHLDALCRQVAAMEGIVRRKMRLVRASLTAFGLAAVALVAAVVTGTGVW